jgi:hypothetical protein
MVRVTTCLASAVLLIVLGSTAKADTRFGGSGFSLYIGSGGYVPYSAYYGTPWSCQPYAYRAYRPLGVYGWYGTGGRGYAPYPYRGSPGSHRVHRSGWPGPNKGNYRRHR